MISQAGRWTRTPSATPLKPKKWNAHFCITFNFWWLARLVIGLKHHPPALSSKKKWNAHFWIMFNFWWSAGLVEGLKPHLPPISRHKIKCSFLHYIQLVMIGRAGQWTQTPSATPHQPKKWNANFRIMFNFWWLARFVDGLKPHLLPLSSQKMKCSFLNYVQFWVISQAGRWTQTPSTTPLQPKNAMLIFGLCSTSDDRSGWSMDLNPICHPCLTKKVICSFLDYVQLLMIGQAGQWTRTPSTIPLQPKKWSAHFWITFNFWWSAELVNGLEHPSTTPLQPKKWNACFWINFNFWWSARLVDGVERHPPPLSSQRMKCSFLDYVQLLMTSWAGQWTRIPSATPLQIKKWYAHFCITFNFWWLARLVKGLQPHLQPLSNQKYEMLVFGLRSTSDDQPGWWMDSNPICKLFPTNKMKCLFWYYVQLLLISWAGRWTQTPSVTPLQPKKWNACFCIMFNSWWSARLVDGLEPHLPPLSSQKNEMLIFVLHSISDDWPGWSLDSNTIHLPSQAKKKWNAHFWIIFNFWWSAGLVDGVKPHLPPLSRHKIKCSFLHYIQLVMIGRAGQWTQTPSATPLQPKNEMLIFGLLSISGDPPGWSMHSNPIHHPSPAKKCNAHFWITFNFWWSVRLVNGLEPHLSPLSSQRIKCSFLDYIQLLMIGRAGQWTRTPSASSPNQENEMLISGLCSTSDDQPGWSKDSNPICNLSPTKKIKSHFLFTFNFWWSAGLVDGLKPHLWPLWSQKSEMLIFVLHSTSDDWPGWSLDSNSIHLPSQAKKMKCSFLDYIYLLMISRAGWGTRTPSATSLQA